MRLSVGRAALLLMALFATVILPAPTQAQLGGLARRAKAAAKDKAEEVLPFTPLPAPAFDGRLIEITEDHLASLLRGFDAEVAYASRAGDEYKERSKAHERALEAYEKASEKYEKDGDKYRVCEERFNEQEGATAAAIEEKVEKALSEMDDDEFEDYLLDLALRGERLARDIQAGKNDPATIRRQEEFGRDAEALVIEQQRRTEAALSGMLEERRRERTENPRLIAACGKEPERPTQPVSDLTGPEGLLAAQGAEAAGLTRAQYAIMRERVLYWSAENGRPNRIGFSEDEMIALTDQKDAVKKTIEGLRKAKIPL